MQDASVALTDYIIAAECLSVSILLMRCKPGAFRLSFLLMFAGIGIAALTGGTVHGYFPDREVFPGNALWTVTLLGIGTMALSGWRIGADLLLPEKTARLVRGVALLEFLGYGIFVVAVSHLFKVAVFNYLPAVLFMLAGLAVHYRKTKARPVLLGIVALLMTFSSSYVQQAEISIDPVYLNYNTLYHIIQFGAIIFLYIVAKYLAVEDKR